MAHPTNRQHQPTSRAEFGTISLGDGSRPGLCETPLRRTTWTGERARSANKQELQREVEQLRAQQGDQPAPVDPLGEPN
uniref:Uncharacterized protein n=1 Tax=Sphaerodactylus townsendi TaxID=933632 RepID=A0ACB8F0K9_9SAUR